MARIVPFVIVRNGQFELDASAATWLAERKAPFAIVACAGKFRTGKSFLLNKLARHERDDGFGVGDTVQACTRGLWLSTNVLRGEKQDVVFVDTEGIDALDATSDHDVRVFALALLLSSTLVYNSLSHLDEAAVQSLALMTRVAEAVGDACTPTLYWVLRDFALQLVDANGEHMSHAAYLEQALCGDGAVRRAVRDTFRTRHLVTLPRPYARAGKSGEAVQPHFERNVSTLRDHIAAHAPCVCAAGVPMSGAVYVRFVHTVLESLNKTDQIPAMRDSWTLIASAQHADVEQRVTVKLCDAARDCPVGSADDVRQWVRHETTHALSNVRFVPPEPDADAHTLLAKRVEDAAMCAAEVAGRIVNHAQRVEDAVQTLMTACDDGWRATLPTDRLAEDVRSASCALFYERAWSTLVPVYVRTAREEGARDAMCDKERELEETRATVEYLRGLLADRPMCATMVSTVIDDSSADAFTQTDESPVRDDQADARDQQASQAVAHLRDETALSDALAAADAATVRANEAEVREEVAREAFAKALATMRTDAAAALTTARSQRDAARAAEAHVSSELEGVRAVVGQLRETARDAQAKAVELHKTTLEDLRRRDDESRDAHKERDRTQTECVARAAAAERESRGLKRRVADLDAEVSTERRVRSKVEVDRARDDARAQVLDDQLSATRVVNESLRRDVITLERRVAVAEVTAKLEETRRSLL